MKERQSPVQLQQRVLIPHFCSILKKAQRTHIQLQLSIVLDIQLAT